MGEGKERRKRRRKAKSLCEFEWSKEEELNLLKKLVEFSTNNIPHEQFYPFLRNGSSLADVSKIQIFDKIQQLKNKYLDDEKMTEEVEAFELSKRLWLEKTQSASTSKALDESNMRYFEEFLDTHGLELDLFTSSFDLEANKKEVDQLFCLQNHHFLIKANLNAQVAQLKHQILQTRFNYHSNQ